MLSLQEALIIKESNYNLRILYFKYNNVDFLFRPLTPVEYSKTKNIAQNNEEFNDLVCQLTVLYPEDYDFSECPYGCLVDKMAKEILDFSLIGDPKSIFSYLEYSRNELNQFINQCTLFIKSAFSEYSIEEIESWDYYKIMNMTAKAEYLLKLKGIECVIEMKDSDEEAMESESKITDDVLLESGIDPMFYNNYSTIDKDIMEYPIILGANWKNERNIENVRKQILEGRHFREKLQR